MKQKQPPRYFRRRVRKGLVETVARLSVTLGGKLGRAPTDEELASFLAMGVGSIRKARGRTGGRA